MFCEDEAAHVTLVRCDSPFEILRGRYVRQKFAPHMHDTYAVGVIESGSTRIRYRGVDVTHVAGGIVVIEPQEVHTGEPVDTLGWSYCMMYLPRELMARFGSDDMAEPRFAHSSYADPEVARQLVALHRLLESEPDVLQQGSVLASTLHLLCERHATRGVGVAPRPRSASLARVREYLETNFAKAVCLADLATLAGASPFHLIRQFRRAYGLPPYMFLEVIRIDRAKEMLQQGVRISDVAFATGFSDQSHLTRRFKRVVGVPPGQYARSYARPLMSYEPQAFSLVGA
ncbi:MAG: transcriptional regulator, AraC family [Gemmatimonadetes bacterium]|nr:transcriptional regulator, AraC family [Gemmatimonadota bacterium]